MRRRRQKIHAVTLALGSLTIAAIVSTTGRSETVETTRSKPATDSTADLLPIGGRWFVRNGKKTVYFYRDGERLVDLFSYHAKDSNEDGVDNVRISHDKRFLLVNSQGYPNHPTAQFPNSGNPNSIRVQNFHFRFPLEPVRAKSVTRLPMGPTGMAINGVVFFNPFEAGGMNAVEGYSEIWLDSCCGHPQREGVYHYHKYPVCVKSPFSDDGLGHSPIIGFSFDGYPIHGPYEDDGRLAKDLRGKNALDACNGHSDSLRGYHYHVTPGRFPYITGGYAGVPEASNNHEFSRVGAGAIVNNAKGKSSQGAEIIQITPESASRGKSHTLRIKLRSNFVPAAAPSWVQIGPYEATKITRRGDVIRAEIAIPSEAAVGAPLDCHIEFPGRTAASQPLVVKKNNVFRVALVDDSDSQTKVRQPSSSLKEAPSSIQ